MYHLAYSAIILLANVILSHARHAVYISNTGEKSYLPSPSEPDVCMNPDCVIAAADVLTSMDESVDPCDDFYSFACGGWMKKHEVSEDEPRLSRFVFTSKDVQRQLRDLVESKYRSSDPPFVNMVKDYYNICVDVDTIEKKGSEHLRKMLTFLGGWPVVEGSQWDESSFDWVDTLIAFRKLGYDDKILLNVFLVDKIENIDHHILCLVDPNMGRLRYANLSLGLEDGAIAAYFRTMVKAAKLLGAEESTAEKEMLEALRFGIALINISKREYLSTTGEAVNKTFYTVAKLQNELPQVPWLKVINGILLNDKVYENETFINLLPDFLVQFTDLITSTEKRVIANYMVWRAVLQSKKYLSEEWRVIEKEGESSKKSKSPEVPRWQICLKNLQEEMSIGLGAYYVKHCFNPESKDEAVAIMKYIHREFLKILEGNDWMDEKTREKAIEKAKAMTSYIGYTDIFRNDTIITKTYENLTLTTSSYLENFLEIQKWNRDRELSELRKPSKDSKDQWEYSQQITWVNTLYSNGLNKIVIPAGILQESVYDKDRPNYMNFGTIGYLIGHEITHGFDNGGRKFDKDGKFINWWDKETDEHFNKKVKCIIDQYDNYTTFIGLKVNGELTQDENIADNGGLKEAYRAYQSWTKEKGIIEPLLPGLNYTQNQLFWLSAAHMWCSKYIPEALKEQLADAHSPEKFRILGPMSNMVEFSKDFKCPPDAPMNRKYKCEVW